MTQERKAHPEAICERCHRPNVTWFAPSELWNQAVRNRLGFDPMLCPTCFIVAAEATGIQPPAWRVAPETYQSERATAWDAAKAGHLHASRMDSAGFEQRCAEAEGYASEHCDARWPVVPSSAPETTR